MVIYSNDVKFSTKIITIISFVSFCSNWHFGYEVVPITISAHSAQQHIVASVIQITYINTAYNEFYLLAQHIHSLSETKSATDKLSLAEWSQIWSIIVSSFYAGTLIGFLAVPFLVQFAGSVRNALLYSSFPAVIGCLIQLLVRLSANELSFVLILSVGRILVGIQAGCSLCLLPPFIIETSRAEQRPFLSSFQQVFQSLATLIGLFIGSDIIPSFGGWKIEFLQLFGLFPTVFFICLLVFLPETPFRLLEQCQESDTATATTDPEYGSVLKIKDKEVGISEFERSAIFYYGRSVNFDIIREEVSERWSTGMNGDEQDGLKNKANLKGLLVGSASAISFAFSADDLIDSYSSDFLVRSSKTETHTAVVITILFGVLLFLSSIVGAFLIDRFGRKRLLISGLMGTAISNLIAALGSAFGLSVVVTAGFSLTKIFIGFGAGAPAWFLTSELVSPTFVCTAQAISTGSLLVVTGLSTLSFMSLQDWIGSPLALLILSTIPALFLALFLIFMLPETKGRSYTEIRNCLEINKFPGIPQISSSISTAEPDETDLLVQRRANRRRFVSYNSQRLMTASYASYGSFRNIGKVDSYRTLRNGSMLSANSLMTSRTPNFSPVSPSMSNFAHHRYSVNDELLLIE